tara:strand:- start:47 stop:463 length:417 start_codon:yes stop_codon:yes gene_type:complete
MEIKEIINNYNKILTVTKTPEGLVWPVSTTPKRCIYYIIFNNILVKIGQTKNFNKRSNSYRVEAKKLNLNQKASNNGSVATVYKLNELMNVGQTAEIYAWFVESKKHYELHNGKRVPITVNMLKLENNEIKKYNPLLK